MQKNEEQDFCGDCKNVVGDNAEAIFCDICELWFHIACQKLSKHEYVFLKKQKSKSQIHWYCDRCNRNSANFAKILGSLKSRQDSFDQRLIEVEGRLGNLETEIPKDGYDKDSIISLLKDDIQESLDQERRRLNLIIKNIPEQENELEFVNGMLRDEDISDGRILSAERIGPVKENELRRGESMYCRPVRITCPDTMTKWKILKKSKSLRNSKKGYNQIFIDLDLTKSQRIKEKELRDELRRRRDDGERNIGIKKGKIVAFRATPT